MTAVVGILNKRGVAIAADSAVTRTRTDETKVTKNGNKMVRVSNAVPISVMITGSADYLGNPWDLVVRCYRKDRGDVAHSTVKECVLDFFDYISSNDQLWNSDIVDYYIADTLRKLFSTTRKAVDEGSDFAKKLRSSNNYTTSPAYIRAFIRELKRLQAEALAGGICPQFEGYTIESFKDYAQNIIEKWVVEITETSKSKYVYPKSFISDILKTLQQTLFLSLTTRTNSVNGFTQKSSELIFTGYGSEQDYPSLVATKVGAGLENRVNYHIRKEDIVSISDEIPAAICPFAQTDISKAIVEGVHKTLFHIVGRELKSSLDPDNSILFDGEQTDLVFKEMLSEVKIDNLLQNMTKSVARKGKKNQQEWVMKLKDYDLKAMAMLAESMIELTGFHRILNFQQEGVGGLIDLAVITKNDGFTWLNRKSWYGGKDVNGQYGRLGV